MLDIYNKEEGVMYHQEWSNNMSHVEKAVLSKKGFPKSVEEGKNGFTQITFYPDFKQFHLTGNAFTHDCIQLMKKQVYDAAMTVSFHNVKLILNDKPIEIKDILSYTQLYFEHLNDDNQDGEDGQDEQDETMEDTSEPNTPRSSAGGKKTQFMTFTSNDSKVVIAPSFSGEFSHVAFANGVYTSSGGIHVDTWCEAIFRPIVQKLNGDSKQKKNNIDIRDVRKHFFMFIFSTLDQPEYEPQTKTFLKSPAPQTDVKPAQIAKLMKWEFVKRIEDGMKMKEMLSFTNETKRKKGQGRIEGLEDANMVGKKGKSCVLCVSEGKSALGYLKQGVDYGMLGVKGRDYIGMMPIRGKFLNVKNASPTILAKNAEVKSIIQAIGLQYGTDYSNPENFAKLRYKKFVVCADSDSVPGSTPLVLRNEQGAIEIRSIDNITKHASWKEFNDKWYNDSVYDVWTEQGWTPIRHVMKHRTQKQMYRIVTNTGIVDVTEDHSLLTKQAEKIQPTMVSVNSELLHSFPPVLTFEQLKRVSPDFSQLVRHVKFTDSCKQYLDSILEKQPKNVEHHAIQDIYQNLIFEDACLAQSMFLFYKMCNDRPLLRMTQDNKVQIYFDDSVRPEQYQQIVQIIPLGKQDIEVYDLETVNHHFQAGVGELIVHNTDGHHIVGLLYNFFHTLFPTLLDIPGFFNFMRTPIVKLTKPNVSFFYQSQAEHFIKTNGVKKEHIHYFKGLGTSEAKDIKDDFGRRIVQVEKDKHADEQIENIFAKERANYRKDWLQRFEPQTEFPNIKDYEIEELSITNFLNHELILFSLDDCRRSIPSMVDGFKESQRKVLYAALKTNIKNKIKVAQFGADVAKVTQYHHGEVNLFDTIIKMAQRFVGSNNVPLLNDKGNFGSRRDTGDAASARYIFTMLEPWTRLLFRDEDSDYLKYQTEDGDIIEPEYYLPILPYILINGNSGIGSGWSTNVTSYRIDDMIEYIKFWIKLKNNQASFDEQPTIRPFFRGFKGQVMMEDKVIRTTGVFNKIKDNEYTITEIPIGRKQLTIVKYRKHLEKLLDEGIISDMKDYSVSSPHFVIKCDSDLKDEDLGLTDTIFTSNMVLFNSQNKLNKYHDVNEIMDEFCNVRYEFYNTRKQGEIARMKAHVLFLQNKVKFIEMVLQSKIDIKQPEETVVQQLQASKFTPKDDSFDYLLTLPIRSMTEKRLGELRQDVVKAQQQLKQLEDETCETTWLKECNEFVKAIQPLYQEQKEETIGSGKKEIKPKVLKSKA